MRLQAYGSDVRPEPPAGSRAKIAASTSTVMHTVSAFSPPEKFLAPLSSGSPRISTAYRKTSPTARPSPACPTPAADNRRSWAWAWASSRLSDIGWQGLGLVWRLGCAVDDPQASSRRMTLSGLPRRYWRGWPTPGPIRPAPKSNGPRRASVPRVEPARRRSLDVSPVGQSASHFGIIRRRRRPRPRPGIRLPLRQAPASACRLPGTP